jgi:Ca-activated chloride channel homolog
VYACVAIELTADVVHFELRSAIGVRGCGGILSANRFLVFLGGVTVIAASFSTVAAPAAPQGNPQVTTVSGPQLAKTKYFKSSASLRVDVKMVPIPVAVSDLLGRPISGLTLKDFHLFEDNVEQKIVSVMTEGEPISLGIIFDTSASMNHKLDTSVAAVEEFLKTNVPGDEYLLVKFSTRPELIADFTDNVSEISGWLHSFQADGRTALYDAIHLGIHKMRTAKNTRKALMILSDGGDNSSRYTAVETRRLVEEADVRIYSVSLKEWSHVLEQVSDETGGEMVKVHRMSELPGAMEKVSRDLRSHYVLYYYPTNPQRDGRYRKVRLQVNQARVHASWRRGYYAPN